MSYDEEYLAYWEDKLWKLKRRSDGFWDIKPEQTIDVKKRDEKIRPIGTVGELFQRKKVGIMDVEKSAYEDERRILEQRVERLERLLMPYESKAFKKLTTGSSFDVGVPRMKITPQTQPNVKREEVKLEELANRTVKSILRGEFTQKSLYDGMPFQCLNVELMLAKTLQKLKKQR